MDQWRGGISGIFGSIYRWVSKELMLHTCSGSGQVLLHLFLGDLFVGQWTEIFIQMVLVEW